MKNLPFIVEVNRTYLQQSCHLAAMHGCWKHVIFTSTIEGRFLIGGPDIDVQCKLHHFVGDVNAFLSIRSKLLFKIQIVID